MYYDIIYPRRKEMNKPFLDVKTGQWFSTLAELKEFQRNGVQQANQEIQQKRKPEPKKIEPSPEVIHVPQPVIQEQEEEEESGQEEEEDFSISPQEDGTAEVTVRLSREQMEEALANAGVDKRSWSRKTNKALAELYFEVIKR